MLKGLLSKVRPADVEVRRVGSTLEPASAINFVTKPAWRIDATPGVAKETKGKVKRPSFTGDTGGEIALNDTEKAFMSRLAEDDWRGIMPGVVAPANTPYCVVLDMRYNAVRIMATHQQQASGSYLTLLNNLKSKHYTIEEQLIGTVGAIRQVHALAESMNRSVLSAASYSGDERYQRLFDDLVTGAYKLGASDLHCELDIGGPCSVKLRIRGRLYQWKRFDFDALQATLTAGYSARSRKGTNSAGSFSIERGMSTMTRVKYQGATIDTRFSSLPTADGGDAVLRLIVNDPNSQNVVWSVPQLGYARSHGEQIRAAIARNAGLIVIAGSTGAGKSKSLQTFMDMLPNKEELKRVAVEDPSEYVMPGVRRFSIQRGPDDPEDEVRQKFLGTLRQQMRMDPDVIMIGEIRDKESGEIAAESVMTGHRVLTTLHGDGCVDVIARAAGKLIQIPEEILAMRKFILATMYQRLLPTLCSCKRPAIEVLSKSQVEALWKKVGLDAKSMHCANDEGCPECRIRGVLGRAGTKGLTVCAEILTPTAAIRSCIAERDWSGVERHWRGQRKTTFDSEDMTGKTAYEHALYKASIGLIDVRDIEAEFEPLESYEVYPVEGGQ